MVYPYAALESLSCRPLNKHQPVGNPQRIPKGTVGRVKRKVDLHSYFQKQVPAEAGTYEPRFRPLIKK